MQQKHPEKATRRTHVTYGYARVSSRDQNLARQLDALRDYGIDAQRIYADQASGKDFRRPAYRKLMSRLRAGDTLVVKSIDRLGRNYDEILDEWRRISKARQVGIVVLDMPLLDTTREVEGLTGSFIVDIMLQLLSYIAQVERENIRQRQAEGIAAARARGVQFGRPRRECPEVFNEVCNEYLAGAVTGAKAAELCGVSRSTFLRWVRALEGAISA